MKTLCIVLFSLFLAACTDAEPIQQIVDGDIPWSQSVEIAQACCKHCSSGKACGDSCIARNRRCSKGRGCACD